MSQGLTEYWVRYTDLLHVTEVDFGDMAYISAYKADDVARVVKELTDALRALTDVQNGPPLFKYEVEWNAAMIEAQRLLAELGIKETKS